MCVLFVEGVSEYINILGMGGGGGEQGKGMHNY